MGKPWRIGRKIGRTIYRGDELIGVMDTADLAALVVDAVNAWNRRTAPTVKESLEVAAPHAVPPEPLQEFVLECVGGRHRFDCEKFALHCSVCGRRGHNATGYNAPKCPDTGAVAPPAVPGEPRARCPPSHYASPDSPPADPTGAEPPSPTPEYHATGGNPPPEVLKLVQQEYERRFPACEECGGNGWINCPVEDDARYCDACNGTGRPTGAEPGTGKP